MTEDELIPYRLHNYGNKTENGIAEDKASEAQVNTGLDNEYGKQKDNNEYDNIVMAKLLMRKKNSLHSMVIQCF